MSNPTPPVIAAMLCDSSGLCHSAGQSCTSAAAGHAVSAIRERVAAATPSKWRDGIVVHVSDSGVGGSWLGIELLGEPETTTGTTWVWNHADLGTTVAVGEPIALHELYDTLAIGATRISVLRASRRISP